MTRQSRGHVPVWVNGQTRGMGVSRGPSRPREDWRLLLQLSSQAQASCAERSNARAWRTVNGHILRLQRAPRCQYILQLWSVTGSWVAAGPRLHCS
eukprot:2915162-Prymnesium_polylepis.2